MAVNRSLPLFHVVVGCPVVVVAQGAMDEARRRSVERAGGVAVGEAQAHQARLAFVALDDAREAEKVALRLKRRGLLVNVADRPELCDFTMPSVLDRAPVLVAVGTGGASAGLAKQLRLALERVLPSSLGALAGGLSEMRERIRGRWPDATERRQAIDAALTAGGPLDPLDAGSAARVEDWLAGESYENSGGRRVIALTSDDPDDLTLRQARWLGEADLVLYDESVPQAILDGARADAERRITGQRLSGRELDHPPETGGTIVEVRSA